MEWRGFGVLVLLGRSSRGFLLCWELWVCLARSTSMIVRFGVTKVCGLDKCKSAGGGKTRARE